MLINTGWRHLAFDCAVGSTTNEAMEMYCTRCGTILKRLSKGDMIFTSTKGICDCSWQCCEHPSPVHPAHFGHRPGRFYIPGEIVDAYSHDGPKTKENRHGWEPYDNATILCIEGQSARLRLPTGRIVQAYTRVFTYPRTS